MALTADELAARVRIAREAVGMTQGAVASALSVSRPAISQIEAGKRAVSGLELHRLAALFGRSATDFFAETFQEQNATVVLFRRHPELGADTGLREALSEALTFGRAMSHLERILDIDSHSAALPSYAPGSLRSKWQAVQQGERAARAERRRLGLDERPLPDQVDLLEMQGIRAAQVRMPEEVSGLTLLDDSVGLLVAVNRRHAFNRRRYSFAHEYAHVLFDRDRQANVSHTSDRDSLLEVRANSFAAAFLLPAGGVRRFLGYLAKGAASRTRRHVFDGEGGRLAERRSPPGSQEIRIHDVALLAHHFGVSRLAALYRLKSLRAIGEQRLTQLRQQDAEVGRDTARALGLADPEEGRRRPLGRNRLVVLGVEALRRELISYRRLCELGEIVGVDENALEQLVVQAGIDVRPPVAPLPVDWEALRGRSS
ncbi:MAG: XRE family transcriptional regulator [Acidobacteria bacterium]|nr:XRE family transcriptional regulator [Acidobacteriota bacterium]